MYITIKWMTSAGCMHEVGHAKWGIWGSPGDGVGSESWWEWGFGGLMECSGIRGDGCTTLHVLKTTEPL